MKWTALRPIQVEAIHKILEGDKDLILAAATASGKTEAAFLPIISRIHENPATSIRALYVGPLKALINDQFRRLDDLCQYAEIPVHPWHGDVSASKKQTAVTKPSGILLITPESLEALFVHRSSALERMFADLSFVVIDELHAFLGRERGTHLRSLLFRLARRAGKPYRLIALSATLGDMQKSAEWLRPGEAQRVDLITDAADQKTVHYKLYGFRNLPQPQADEPTDKPVSPTAVGVNHDLVEEMMATCCGSKNLIFANARQNVEIYADALNECCRAEGRPAEFLVHHGSLSKELREQTEELMRASRPATTVCSSSLELGIDIGSVKSIGQIGAPWSVSALVQRLGRSGRREGEQSIMRVYIVVDKPDSRSPLAERLYPELLQAVALTELMLERWIEPPQIHGLDLSTCLQQVLSVLAETGGTSPEHLLDTLVTHGAFRNVDPDLLVDLLLSMGEHDLVERMETEGDLILGLAGQQVVSHYQFYSAFATPEEYRVTCDGSLIGLLPALFLPAEHEHLILAARRWEVLGIDHDRSEILVRPARGRKPPKFLGAEGEIHPRVRQKMREVLLSNTDIRYLNEEGDEMLREARAAAAEAALGARSIVPTGDGSCAWFTWTGTVIQRTLVAMTRMLGVEAQDRGIAIEFESPAEEIGNRLRQLSASPPTALTLAEHVPAKFIRKYDPYLNQNLLNRQLADSLLDVPGALTALSLAV
jgi:ATP-dependent Lhr-like helicase